MCYRTQGLILIIKIFSLCNPAASHDLFQHERNAVEQPGIQLRQITVQHFLDLVDLVIDRISVHKHGFRRLLDASAVLQITLQDITVIGLIQLVVFHQFLNGLGIILVDHVLVFDIH